MSILPSCFLLIEPATFVKRLADFSVETGSPIVLEATFTGTPPISVNWMKNEFPLTQSENCSITMTERSSILEILDSTVEDYAQYSCLIENEAGQDICEALVSVLGVLTITSSYCSLLFLLNILFSLAWLTDYHPLYLRTTLFYRASGTCGSSHWRTCNFTV